MENIALENLTAAGGGTMLGARVDAFSQGARGIDP
jgi:hypothetical protein